MRPPIRRVFAATGWAVVRCVALIPVGLAALIATLLGHRTAATRWWARLGRQPAGPATPGAAGAAGPGSAAGPATAGSVTAAAHAVASVLLGVVALVPLGAVALSLLRGLFYGLVDPGPYDNAWGGPTRAGAWAAHLLISVPLVVAGLIVLVGVAALHRRLSRLLTGGRPGWWVLPTTALAAVLAVLLLVGWLRQL